MMTTVVLLLVFFRRPGSPLPRWYPRVKYFKKLAIEMISDDGKIAAPI
jgi:hypothetical protein